MLKTNRQICQFPVILAQIYYNKLYGNVNAFFLHLEVKCVEMLIMLEGFFYQTLNSVYIHADFEWTFIWRACSISFDFFKITVLNCTLFIFREMNGRFGHVLTTWNYIHCRL